MNGLGAGLDRLGIEQLSVFALPPVDFVKEMRAAMRAYLAAMPPRVTISLEVPLSSQAEAGVGPEIRMRRCVDAARRLLAEVEA